MSFGFFASSGWFRMGNDQVESIEFKMIELGDGPRLKVRVLKRGGVRLLRCWPEQGACAGASV